MIPQPVLDWLEEHGMGSVTASHSVGGGCINNGTLLDTESGVSFFLKTNTYNPADMFTREAEGLLALAVKGGPRVPRPYVHGRDFLLLEDLKPAPRSADHWSVFGRQLAVLHQHTRPHFGFEHDNYIGSMPQSNLWMEDGYKFFGQQRLLFQAHMARRRGLLERNELAQVERLVARLTDLIPEQPASLIHGDLWTGNAISDSTGGPAIIDPATHYGWAEAELAMTTLFGAFPESFYCAYQEVRPLDTGLEKRYPLYNLYHLLNHLNLFGPGYLGQVTAILRRY
jgi:protein-ribulosamine 3-kinase